ncbi:MAG: hypothetical protein CTY20_02420 [Hyphomicrobium sp.]|nr:MAG: hypothetical protein CTY20_02420 [Hyphomicrobium sp.]
MEARLSDIEPIRPRPHRAGTPTNLVAFTRPEQVRKPVTTFDRQELSAILAVYGRKVAAGDWRDYAIDLGAETAVFSVFRRASECPIYRIQKSPRDARKQGTYSVVAASGMILKRGRDLARVLGFFEPARLID